MGMSAHERAAFERLLKIGRGDTGQSRKVANFILAWWNADTHGGFDLTELFGVDEVIAADMATVFVCLSRNPVTFYPEECRSQIEQIIKDRRPEAWARANSPEA